MSSWYDFQVMIYTLVLLVPRMASAFAFSGFMSRSLMPVLIRNMLALNLSIFVYPLMANKLSHIDWGWGVLLLIIAKEIFLGMFIGFLAGIAFWAAESAGFFIDNQRGGAIASAINPLSGANTTPLGIFFMHMITIYFFISGIFLFFIGMLFDSYMIWPVWQFLPALEIIKIKQLLGIMDKLFLQTLLLSSPMIITMLLSELGLGLINRFAPQLQVFFVSMSVKSLVLFVVFIIYFGFLIELFREMLLEITLIPKLLHVYLGE